MSEMSHGQAVADTLARMQRVLLEQGYDYVQAKVDGWPFRPVVMARDEHAVLVGPFPLPVQLNPLELTDPHLGVLLAGAARADDPAVAGFLASLPCQCAYVDAVGGGTAARGQLPSLSQDNLRRYADASRDAKLAARFDCQDHIARLGQQEAFYRAGKAQQGAWPVATVALMALCIGVFLLELAQGLDANADRVLLGMGADFGPMVKAGQYWRMLTCGFLHLDLMHVGFNMMALWIFGRQLEMLQGRWRLAVFFLVAVVGGSVASLAWHPLVISAGASGGLFGLLGAMAALIIRRRREFPGHVWRAIRRWIISILGYNAIMIVMPQIDIAAHVGGFIAGLAIGLPLCTMPLSPRRPRLWEMLVAGVVLAALLVLAVATIWHIPPMTRVRI